MSQPNKAEKAYWDRLSNEVGCIACRIDGHKNQYLNNHVSIHHCDGRTKPGAHMNVLPLCNIHHQHGRGDEYPSIHPWKARFEAKYGTQEELKAQCDRILNGTIEG